MTTQNEDRDVLQPHSFDPFPQPQTIPSGWDLSGLLSTSEPASAQQAADTAETESN
jgi:hypothetical protein